MADDVIELGVGSFHLATARGLSSSTTLVVGGGENGESFAWVPGVGLLGPVYIAAWRGEDGPQTEGRRDDDSDEF